MNDSRIVPVFQILAEDIHALGIRTVFGPVSYTHLTLPTTSRV